MYNENIKIRRTLDMSTFKDGFLWGGAVAAHQLEGGW
ncbi:glycosyl hydrolase family protein [Streptococcus anginosus]|nr:family 1 glycosylhydrolase [Streptococcus anginosus]RRR18648.1 glycosyl hydrolase family protein [Streptococcus anginosus]